MTTLTIQTYHGGWWHDAATLEIKAPERGIVSPCTLDYDLNYFSDFASVDLADGIDAIDVRALSVRIPVNMDFHTLDHWPAFLLDLLPQGHARQRLAQELGHRADDPAVELPLLLRGAGSPIGNIRIREAWELEQERVAKEVAESGPCPGVTMDDILGRSDTFLWVVDRFALVASGSSGVQGEWPKVLMTQATDGLWYPDSIVPDAEARAHVIVKLSRAKQREDAVILEAEAPYLEVAREFGLGVAQPLTYAPNVLVIPRFDRVVTADGLERYGQESLVSAIDIAEFGYQAKHEQYLTAITKVSTDPAAEVTEYVLRDLLNFAMGNPDNHGRNSALQKRADGAIGLTPLFDFAPMKLDPSAISRATKWAVLGGRDAMPDWRAVCEKAAEGVMDAGDLMAVLAEKTEFLQGLPDIARHHGVPEEAIERACRFHAEMANGVAQLKGANYGL